VQRQPWGARGGDAGCCWELDRAGVTFSLAGGFPFLLMKSEHSLGISCDVNKSYLVLLTFQPTQEKKDGLGSLPVLMSAKK